MEKKKCVVLLSGGPDSATLALRLKKDGYEVNALHIDYGNPSADAENKSAEIVAKHVGIPLATVEVKSLNKVLAMEEQETLLTQSCKVLPAGPTYLLWTAVLYAHRLKASKVFIAVHADDVSTGLREIQREYLDKLNQLISALGGNITIETPFYYLNKVDILKIGLTLGLPIEKTWSCILNSTTACGYCRGCLKRQAARRKLEAEEVSKEKLISTY